MFRLSSKTDYGLIFLSNLAKTEAPLSVAKVAKKYQIPAKFLSQIATELKKAGMINAKEGMRGGYALASDPKNIKILDVLKTLDGDLVKGECFKDDHECNCGGKDIWIQMKQSMEKVIGKKTVADLG